MNNELDDDLEPQEISKTVIKKEMHDLHLIGVKMVGLTQGELKKVPLEEKLFDAISQAKKITKHGGLKRQLKYIGKLMRHVDPEPILEAIIEIESGFQQNKHLFHLKEQWREKLLDSGGDSDTLTEFYAQYPNVDLQRLRQLIRNHKTAKNDDKKKHTSRLVFKMISAVIV